MEQIQGTSKSSEFEQEDYISSMPDNVVSNIFDRLPLQDVIKTSILASYWRFKWTMLSQLVFDKNFFNYLLKTKTGGNNYGRIISRLLLNLNGVITKFVLYYEERQGCIVLDDEDISHWMLFLSGKGLNDLTVYKENYPLLKLPIHLFSCLELKHLTLHNCCFSPPPRRFHGFPNLLSSDLNRVKFQSLTFCELFTRCPVLESLKTGLIYKISNASKVKPIVTANITNHLLTLSKLLGSLPKLQELDLNFTLYEFAEDDFRKNFPTTFSCLRTLRLTSISLGIGKNLLFACEIIRFFPNLQTLEITATGSVSSMQNPVSAPIICFPEVDHNTMGGLQLRSVVFTSFIVSEHEVFLIKYLLACSPLLKKFVIRLHSSIASNEKWMFTSKLLNLRRASLVDFDLCYF